MSDSKLDLDFSLTNESDTQAEDSSVSDFSTEGLLEALDILSQTMAQSQQVYGQSIENLEKRLHALELEYSKLVTLLVVNTQKKAAAETPTETKND